MIHHGTIRKYTAALLDLFNGIEIQYDDSNGNTISKNIPIKYSSREKSKILDEFTTEQLLSGNTNILPKANLSLSTLAKSDQRVQNKNIKINTVKSETQFEYMYNSVPYEFTFELTILCRGMNEAAMIIEQIAPKFNPTVNIDIWDAQNLNEPTRIPVRLLDIGIQIDDYEELSSNLVTLLIGLSIMGNLYPPIKTIERIKDYKLYINNQDGDYYSRKVIMGWDVNENGELINPIIDSAPETSLAPIIIDLLCPNFSIGTNIFELIYDDKDSKSNELTFVWDLIQGNGDLTYDGSNATLVISDYGYYEIKVTISDVTGNYSSFEKIFWIMDPNGSIIGDLNENEYVLDLNLGTDAFDLNLPIEEIVLNDLNNNDNTIDLNLNNMLIDLNI